MYICSVIITLEVQIWFLTTRTSGVVLFLGTKKLGLLWKRHKNELKKTLYAEVFLIALYMKLDTSAMYNFFLICQCSETIIVSYYCCLKFFYLWLNSYSVINWALRALVYLGLASLVVRLSQNQDFKWICSVSLCKISKSLILGSFELQNYQSFLIAFIDVLSLSVLRKLLLIDSLTIQGDFFLTFD